MAEKQSVMIGLPTMTNRITIAVAALIDDLRVATYDPAADLTIKVCIPYGKAPVEYARNIIVGEFLRSNCDKLWFIDEDMLPESSVARLLYSDADIVCAQMYKFDHPNPEKGTTVGLGLCAMVRKENGNFRPFMPEPGSPAIVEVDAVGTGCTIITRRVLEDRRMWTENVYTKITGETVDGNVDPGEGEFAPAVFRHPRASSGFPLCGEDVDLCIRAKALGYTIKVDLLARCGHFKTINVDEAGNLARATVERVVRGIKSEDGRVFKYALLPDEPKAEVA